MGKEKFQRGRKHKNKAGKVFKLKRVFFAGHPSTLAGQCFSGVVTGGVSTCSNSLFLTRIFLYEKLTV